MRLYLLLAVSLLMHQPVQAEHESENLLSEDEWQDVMTKVSLLDSSSLMPSLLPFIMSNRDAIQLNADQLTTFNDWRKQNFVDMVNLMNEIIQMKVRFRVESMSPGIDSHHLMIFQDNIHQRQRELLELRLSCREMLMKSMTDEQWENFAFVASDHPKFSSLLTQSLELQ